MKLRELRIEHFKRFREPLRIADLADGLNLFAAPNEAGKSTVAEAIRAAFFERHRSSAVEHLRPWGQGAATPTVELAFDIGGKAARLTKSFLGKKRCELVIDGRAMDGTAAEDHLAELLGFQYAGRGASAPEHMGIPGLLWIRQGDSHDLAPAVRHAEDHLRQALGQSFGELSSTDGDAVLDAVAAQRQALLTPSDGKPRGEYKLALEQRDALEAERASLDDAIQRYRLDVDRLDALRSAHARDEVEPPWQPLRASLETARQRLDAARGLVARHARQLDVVKQAQARVALSRGQLDAFDQQARTAVERRRALDEATQAKTLAEQALEAWLPRHRDAQQAEQRARQAAHDARQARARAELRDQRRALSERHAQMIATLRTAADENRTLIEREREAARLRIDDATIERVRELDGRLRDVRIRLETIATRLQFALLPGASLTIDGEPPSADGAAPSRTIAETIRGTAARTITQRTELNLPGLGVLTIEPGGSDLEALSRERDALDAELDACLQRIGAADPADVEARAARFRARQADAELSRKLLGTLAPDGLEALDARCQALGARIESIGEASGADDDAEGTPAIAGTDDVAAAEALERDARDALNQARSALEQARMAAAATDAALAAARREWQLAQTLVDDPASRHRHEDAQRQLVEALSIEAVARRELDELEQQLRDANPTLLEQDVQRLTASIGQAEASHRQRRDALARLEGELDTRGALGLEEAAAEKRRDLAMAARRAEQLQRRANALDLLHRLLTERRAALAQRLRAPLQKYVNRYLQILFPGARIEVGDDLAPGPITRDGPAGLETGTFDALSLGTREQMGVIARLAYADLLREAGRPTLLILDDALVHSDEDRLAQMKRVLYDAASRHQILIFTCHPAAWRDLGVAARALA